LLGSRQVKKEGASVWLPPVPASGGESLTGGPAALHLFFRCLALARFCLLAACMLGLSLFLPLSGCECWCLDRC